MTNNTFRIAIAFSFLLASQHLLSAEASDAQPSVDASFGLASVVQQDGKIIAAGGAIIDRGSSFVKYSAFLLTRFNPDGSRDTGFGTDGIVTTRIELSASGNPLSFIGNSSIRALAVQQDGKIVAAGQTYYDGGKFGTQLTSLTLVRYEASGVLDSTFGRGGIVTTQFPGRTDGIFGVVVQKDGKLIAASNVYNSISEKGDISLLLARYNSDGSLDGSFGNGGVIQNPIFQQVRAMVVQADGKIIIAGNSEQESFPPAATHYMFALARYNSNGSIDRTFGRQGVVLTRIDEKYDNYWTSAYALALQSDGRIVAAGAAALKNSSQEEFAIVRYNTNGSLDAGFGQGGISLTSHIEFVGSGYSSYPQRIYSVSIQDNGKILAAGDSVFTKDGHTISLKYANLVRYNMDGSVDKTFGDIGVEGIMDKGSANSLSLQADGKIVVVGDYCPSYPMVSYDCSHLFVTRRQRDGAYDGWHFIYP
ncbi:MAG: hypothetical protein HY537_13435 [Deltaproteobacteria bacterium]|nr:hypothetical protein [Deltaproteobacteria bacterium]